MALTFYVGEQPSDPLIITVRDENGEPLALHDVSAVALVGDELPAGTCAINDPVSGRVQYTFSAPFTSAGTLTLQVAMTDEDEGIDYSAPFTLTVADPSEVIEPIVTPAQVEAWTGTSVSESDITQAQGLVSIASGRNLSDQVWLASLSNADAYWLSLAVGYQAAEGAMAATGLAVPYVPGAQSIANGDVRITFKDNAGSEVAGLTNLANAALQRLSWMKNFRSIQAQPFSKRGEQPSPWRKMSVDAGWPL
jgi:hypothetical protein